MVLFINKNNAFKRNTSHLRFFMFFRANDFQEKLGNNSFIFKFNLTSHQLSDDQFPSVLFTKFEKKPKVNTRNIGSSYSEVFYKISFMTL